MARYEDYRVFKTAVGGRLLQLEIGKVCEQANGQVMLRYGDTVVNVTACASKEPKPDIDFFPLSVDVYKRQVRQNSNIENKELKTEEVITKAEVKVEAKVENRNTEKKSESNRDNKNRPDVKKHEGRDKDNRNNRDNRDNRDNRNNRDNKENRNNRDNKDNRVDVYKRQIDTNNFIYEDGKLEIFAIGITATEQLNKNVADKFKHLLKDNFSIEAKVLFKNNSKIYEETFDEIKKNEENEIKEAMKLYSEKIRNNKPCLLYTSRCV